jgi:coenzyme Q-binding protein COQ10
VPNAQRSIDINVPVEKLFEVVQDFSKYPEFIPEMRRVSVLRKTGATQDVEFELEIDLPLGMKKRIIYSLTFNEDRPNGVRWQLIKGEYMKGNVGSWTFRTLGEDRTQATYTIDLSFGPLVPKVIANFLAEQSLPKMLGEFKRRAEGLASAK